MRPLANFDGAGYILNPAMTLQLISHLEDTQKVTHARKFTRRGFSKTSPYNPWGEIVEHFAGSHWTFAVPRTYYCDVRYKNIEPRDATPASPCYVVIDGFGYKGLPKTIGGLRSVLNSIIKCTGDSNA